MAEDRLAQRERVFQQYKRDVKERGKPFYPYAMFHDTLMSFVVAVVIIGLAVIWKWTTPGHHTGFNLFGTTDHPDQAGWLGKLYDEPADPGTISFVPRPDWYFYFLFYLLRIFKWPDSVILGTVGIPTIALVLLIALPFIDLRSERRPLHRPVAMVAGILAILSMGILTYKGATAQEALPTETPHERPGMGKERGFYGQQAGGCRSEALRRRRLRQLPHLSRHRQSQSRCARSVRRGRKAQGRRLPDRPSEVPFVRQQGQSDAVLCERRHKKPQRAGGVPRGFAGPQVGPCA